MIKRQAYFLSMIILFLACSSKKSTSLEGESVPNIRHSFVDHYTHDTTAFTEGFLFHNGELWESTGATTEFPQTRSLFGAVDQNTGEIDTKVELDRYKYFGEGISFLNGQLFQLTYKSRTGFVYDANTFKKLKEFAIPKKEGWGLTTDGSYLIMSDGTNKLTYLDPNSLRVVKTISVFERGISKDNLNELEYIDGYIYANIWKTNSIVKIDPTDGRVIGKLDMTSYANEARNLYRKAQEMNGIAYDPETGDIFITGKLWPRIYELSIQNKKALSNL